MKLTPENIEQWEQELDKEMLKRLGLHNYQLVHSNEQWLEKYEGQTAEEAAIQEEESCGAYPE